MPSRHRRRYTMTATAPPPPPPPACAQEWWRRRRRPRSRGGDGVYKADPERGRAHRSERTVSPALVVTKNITSAQRKKKNVPKEIRVSFFRLKQKNNTMSKTTFLFAAVGVLALFGSSTFAVPLKVINAPPSPTGKSDRNLTYT